MLELLAVIQSVDPSSLVLWALFVFAAGMYPVGIMLGSSCSPCCGCSACAAGTLPETVTVTFSGLPDQTRGSDLLGLSFSSCFGSGAAGRILEPGGVAGTDDGPISSVSLTNAGSGYAKLGRVAPTITAGGGSGSGATLTVTATQEQDACDVDYWEVSSISVSGGTGYVDGDQVTFTVAEGDTEQQVATATINTTRSAPTLSASAPTGSGATFSISYTANGGSPATWSVSGVSVTAGGTGYSDGSALTLTLGTGDKADSEAYATILTNRLQPTLTASVSSDTGAGATLAVTLTQTTDYDGRAVWAVSSISASNGGSDYVEGDPVSVTVADGQESYYSYFSASVSSVDGGGAITGITIDYGGEYFKDGGVIQSVLVDDGGSYYKDDGVPTGVTVDGGGIYYREDPDEDPYVADVTVTLTQGAPSDGADAVLTATVEDDTGSADFGKITALAITNGGDDYLAWKWLNTKCCGDYYNGMSVVVKRLNYGSGDACLYAHRMCGVGNLRTRTGKVEVRYNGPSSPATVSLFSEVPQVISENTSSSCDTSFTATESVANCSNWTDGDDQPIEFTATGGATATVTAGGEYDEAFRNPGGKACFICCKGDSEMPEEVDLVLTDNNGTGRAGTYVGTLFVDSQDSVRWTYAFGNFSLSVQLQACTFQNSNGFNPVPLAFDENGNEIICDECHNKCGYVAVLNNSNTDVYRSVIQSCEGFCQETPICTPSGTISICSIFDRTDCPYSVSIQ